MAWQGRRYLWSFGGYSYLEADLNIYSIDHDGPYVHINGSVALIYRNRAGAWGSYGYTITAYPNQGGELTYGRWSRQYDGYTQYRDFSATIEVGYGATSLNYGVSFYSQSGASAFPSWDLSFAPGSIPPSGLEAELISTKWNEVKGRTTIASFGTPDSPERYVELGICRPYDDEYGVHYRFVRGTGAIGQEFTIDESAEDTDFGPILGMTAFKLGGYATNKTTSTNTLSSTINYTNPAPGVLTYEHVTNTDVFTLVYTPSVENNTTDYDEADYEVVLEYEVDGVAKSEVFNTPVDMPAKADVTAVFGQTVSARAYQTYKGKTSEVSILSFKNKDSIPGEIGGTGVNSIDTEWNKIACYATVNSMGVPANEPDRYLEFKSYLWETEDYDKNPYVYEREPMVEVGAKYRRGLCGTKAEKFPSEGTWEHILGMSPFKMEYRVYNGGGWFWNRPSKLRHTPPAPPKISYRRQRHSDVVFIYVTAPEELNYHKPDESPHLTAHYTITRDDGKMVTLTDSLTLFDPLSLEIGGFTQGRFFTISVYLTEDGLTNPYNSETVELTIANNGDDVKTYGPIDGKTKLIEKAYGPVSNKAREIYRLYGRGADGLSKLIYAKDVVRRTYANSLFTFHEVSGVFGDKLDRKGNVLEAEIIDPNIPGDPETTNGVHLLLNTTEPIEGDMTVAVEFNGSRKFVSLTTFNEADVRHWETIIGFRAVPITIVDGNDIFVGFA